MKNKNIIGGGIIIVFLGIMVYLFTQTNIQYESNFDKIMAAEKTVKATGNWVKERSYTIDKQNRIFSFYLKDDQGTIMKVLYNGTIPNNFESSTSVVVTGKYHNGVFHATEILTKCPSKYENEPHQNAGL